MKAIDPTLKEMIFTYTDTDSLHLCGKEAEMLREKGYIVSKSNAKLGYLCNDIDDDGIITREINLGPKVYYYEYMTNDNKCHDKGDSTFRCKGIPMKCLKPELYTNYDKSSSTIDSRVCRFSGLKKKHKTLTHHDVNNGVDHFSIVNVDQQRTFMMNEYQGMDFRVNEWFPKGYFIDDVDDKDYYEL